MADKTGFSLPVYIFIVALITGAFLWFAVDPSKPLVVNEEVKSISVTPSANQLELG